MRQEEISLSSYGNELNISDPEYLNYLLVRLNLDKGKWRSFLSWYRTAVIMRILRQHHHNSIMY